MNIWQTPHGSDFVCEALAVLEKGNCLVYAPDPIRQDFISAIVKESERQGCPCVRIAVRDNAEASLEPHFLKRADSLEAYPRIAPRKGHTVLLELHEDSPSWIQDFLRYSGISENRLWNLLCVAAPGTDALPGFRTLSWWGKIHASDSLYGVERAIASFKLGAPGACWHSALCQALCEIDLAMISSLVREAPATPEEICAFLSNHPLASEDTGELVRKFLREDVSLSPDKAPSGGVALQLWKAGALDMAWNGRQIIHPAALLAGGMIKELKVLLTTAQATLYLPMAYAAHALISRKMERNFGHEWDMPKSANEDDNHVREIGPLYSWLSRHYKYEARKEIQLAKTWMNIRHCVAHSDFLPWELALKGVVEYQQMRGN